MAYEHNLPKKDYLPEDPADFIVKEETCDLYGTFGDPSGTEHHACLEELFEGNGFHIEDLCKHSSHRKSKQ